MILMLGVTNIKRMCYCVFASDGEVNLFKTVHTPSSGHKNE